MIEQNNKTESEEQMSGIIDEWDFGGPMTDEDFREIDRFSQKSESEEHNEKAKNNPNQGGQNWN
jgi:hypothetical protein